MKKILLILVTVSSLIFTLTAATLASNVYIDGLVGGNEKKRAISMESPLQPKVTLTVWLME
jgi:hypothetical protein